MDGTGGDFLVLQSLRCILAFVLLFVFFFSRKFVLYAYCISHCALCYAVWYEDDYFLSEFMFVQQINMGMEIMVWVEMEGRVRGWVIRDSVG